MNQKKTPENQNLLMISYNKYSIIPEEILMIICKNCSKEFEEKNYKTEFCSVKCSSQYIGKNKNPIYKLFYPHTNLKDIPYKNLKKLFSIDTYEISKTLKTYELDNLLLEYRNFKNHHKLCKNCGNFYEVEHSKSQDICPNVNCKDYYENLKLTKVQKSQSTKFKNHGDSKYNNRDKFKETYKNKSQEEIQEWNENRSKALQKSKNEWALIIRKREETYFEKTGYKNPLQNPEIRNRYFEKTGYKFPLQNPDVREQVNETNLNKYGVKWVSQSGEVKEKIVEINLKKYGVENVSQSPVTKENIKQTNLQHFGVENVSQSPVIQERITKTNLSKYGTKSHTQSPLYKIQLSQKYKEKYGVGFAPQKHLQNLQNYDSKEFWIENFTIVKNNQLYVDFDKIYDYFGILSHTTIYNKLKDFNIQARTIRTSKRIETEFLNDLNLNLLRQHKIQNFKVDGYEPNTNTVYEFLGDYWHGNLRFLNPEDLNLNTKETFLNLNTQTFKRFNKLLSLGYNIKYIWESDYSKYGIQGLNDYKNYDKIISEFLTTNNIEFEKLVDLFILPKYNVKLWFHRMEANPKYKNHSIHKQTINSPYRMIHLFTPYIDNPKKFNVLKNVILHACGKSQFKEYARNLDICVKPAIETKQFFEENNINGYRNAKHSICLTKNGEILMAYAIGHAYFGKGKYDAEIARGACKLGYSIVGGASKIWNYIIKNFNYNTIVYYVDLNFYDGRSINFLENCRKVSGGPGFWNYWIRTKELKNREPNRHKEIMTLVKEGEILEIQNAGTQVNVWSRTP